MSNNRAKFRQATRLRWATREITYSPLQGQLGTCTILSVGMGESFRTAFRRDGKQVYEFTFFSGGRQVFDVESGKSQWLPGREFQVRLTDRQLNGAGSKNQDARALETAYGLAFGVNTFNGNYVHDVIANLSDRPTDAMPAIWATVEGSNPERKLSAALRDGRTVIFVSDPDISEIQNGLVDLHAYRVLGSVKQMHLINPWTIAGRDIHNTSVAALSAMEPRSMFYFEEKQ